LRLKKSNNLGSSGEPLFYRPVTTPHAQKVRIIGGAFRGRVVRFPRGAEVRPTADRVRETLCRAARRWR
jgi:hypothetical protein